MLNVISSGTLVSNPQERSTAAGKPYCTASLRIPCEDSEPVLISAITFAAEPTPTLNNWDD